MSPLNTKINLHHTKSFSSHLTENKVFFHYEYEFFSVKHGGGNGNPEALKG